jgi:(p)ppGpp synthase/HD superfamily hydrolase
MSEEKKWKRGDIGPDGRVFWAYGKHYRNGERWIDVDRFQQLHEKVTEVTRRYNQENREKLKEQMRRYNQENREKMTEVSRRTTLKKTLQKSTPKTLQQFYASLTRPHITFSAIFSLTPDEGQTLAELIHELSGYPMKLCEQIANPPELEPEPEPEPEPKPTPEPQPPPVILPDLF